MRRLRRFMLPWLAVAGATVAIASVLAPGAFADPAADGAFVIGDGNAVPGTAVTFWGAQWWKENTVSGGEAPPSFKGYALDVDPLTCTFTTRPGNSPPPPDGPLPATITVLVTRSVTKDGPTISGTVVGFAQIATNDGYASDPGHEGTGRVLSVLPCGGGPGPEL